MWMDETRTTKYRGGRFHVIEIGKTFVKNSCGEDLNQSYQLCSEHIPPDHRLLCNLAAFGYSPPAHKLKKKSENGPFYFSNSTSTVCRLLWHLDYWFLQGMDNQRIWDVGRHETLATPHIRLAMKNKHRISRYCINLRRVLIIAGCNFPR